MANNCLVTKLKGVVNSDLPRIGTIRFHSYVIPNSSSVNRTLVVEGQGVEISTEGTGFYFIIPSYSQDRMNKFVVPDSQEYDIVFDEGDYDVEIGNKYALTNISTTETYASNILPKNIDDFSYTNIRRFWYHCNVEDAISGDLSVVKSFSSVTSFGITGKKQSNITGKNLSNLTNLSPNLDKIFTDGIEMSGDVSIFSMYTKLVNIEMFESTGIYGNFESFGPLTRVVNIMPKNYYPRTGITGSIDAFVEAQCTSENPRTSFFMPGMLNGILKCCTFNGVKQESYGWGWLGWDSVNKIYVLEGANTYTACPYVTCKGYSQSEAEAKWPGKTIIRVDA